MIRVAGVLLIVVGFVFFLQGINVLPGSFMTGQMKWAVCGGVMLVAGIVLLLATRAASRSDS
jgi:hypothetical protein